MTEYCPTCGKEIEPDGFYEYRCPKCKVLIVSNSQEKLDKAVARHKCKVKGK